MGLWIPKRVNIFKKGIPIQRKPVFIKLIFLFKTIFQNGLQPIKICQLFKLNVINSLIFFLPWRKQCRRGMSRNWWTGTRTSWGCSCLQSPSEFEDIPCSSAKVQCTRKSVRKNYKNKSWFSRSFTVYNRRLEMFLKNVPRNVLNKWYKNFKRK